MNGSAQTSKNVNDYKLQIINSKINQKDIEKQIYNLI